MSVEDVERTSDYPEHDRLRVVSEQSQAIGDFLEAMSAEGWNLMRLETLYDERDCPLCIDGKRRGVDCRRCSGTGLVRVEVEEYVGYRGSTNRMLANHFGIDLNKIEDEKRAMLDALRGANT